MPSRTECPSCRHRGMNQFHEALGVPAQSSVVLASSEEALAFPKGDVVLASCPACGFVANVAHPAEALIPDADYEDQQGFSPTFSDYARAQVEEMVERYDLRGKTVVEVGCGKGDFLAMLCKAGDNRGVGVDPLFHKERLDDDASARLTAVAELYAERHASFRPHAIVCRHTLEHIPSTRAFLSTLRATLDSERDTAVVIEVPDVTRILREGAFWDVYYEHCSYFTPGSLARAFRAARFDVHDLRREYGDQYIVLHGRAGRDARESTSDIEEPAEEVGRMAERFADEVGARVSEWRERVAGAARPPAIWGSGSKCVAFVTTVGVGERIGRVVDINPRRHGRFMPGVAARIVAPEQLREEPPDTVIVMNPIYRGEVESSVRQMGLDCEVVAV